MKYLLTPLLILSTCIASCGSFLPDPIEEFAKQTPAEIVKQMTLEEKVGQLIHVGMSGKTSAATLKQDIETYHVGGVILFEANLGSAAEIRALTDSAQQIAKGASKNPVPLFVSIDQEGGRVVRVKDGVDQLPGALAVGQTEDEGMAEDVGFRTASQLAKLGIHLLLAPVVDVNNNPANPVINSRSFSGDAEVVTKMALAYARGVQAAGAVPVLKHFPGHGNTNTDSHTALPTVKNDLAHMESLELVPFRAGIAAGAPAIMSAHIVFPALDPGEPATLSPKILKDYLRVKLGFKGLTLTDALEMKAVADRYPPPILARKAFNAGLDVLLLTSTGERTKSLFESLLAGFKSGELSVADLDAAVTRQVDRKLRTGLFHEYGMTRPEWKSDVAESFKARTAAADAHAIKLTQKYPDGLNTAVSRASISALRKVFVVAPDLKQKVKLFARSTAMIELAKTRGIDQSRITVTPSPVTAAAATFAGFCRIGMQCPESIAVELADFDLWRWNLLVAEVKGAGKAGRQVPVLIGLYSGNPYLNIRVPDFGAVLCSFSPTEESVKALVYRLTDVGTVRQARLVLADEK
ncbi:MAG: hypothetical protein K8S54_04350 [Spirochaetia bacterium]|nr:hypothetical protein [Spirochaetia bacterium]